MDSILSLFSLNILKSQNLFHSDIPQELIIKFLKIPPLQRQPREIHVLKALTNNVAFFTKQTESQEFIHYQSCQAMRYEFFPKGQIVFKFGDYGRKFYIIISGNVEVMSPKPGTEELVQVAIIREGNTFGDMALVTENPRNATIHCLTDCHFAVLVKDDYLRILGKITDKKISAFVDFFKEIPVFRAWSKKNIEDLYPFFKILEYTRKKIVFNVGEEADFVYIVNSGEFEISKKVQLVDRTKVGLGVAKSGEFEINKKNSEKTKVDMKIAVLSKGEIFGDEDVLKSRVRECKCTCYSSTGELLAISCKDFLLKIKNEDSLSLLYSKNQVKSIIRSSREAALQSYFEPKHRETKSLSVPKSQNSLNLGKKHFIYEEVSQDYSKYLELSPKDIQNIKLKAMGSRNSKMFISVNAPLNTLYRTPSPYTGVKLKPLKSKRIYEDLPYIN